MKIDQINKTEVSMCFLEGSHLGLLRANPHGMPIWYKATKDGFDLISDYQIVDKLEAAYRDKEQQALQEKRTSKATNVSTFEGPERAKPH